MNTRKSRKRNTIKNRKCRKRNKTKKNGGVNVTGFVKEVGENIIPIEQKPTNTKTVEPYNHTYNTTVTPDSKIQYKFFFITPQTLLLNNVDSVRVPNFMVNGKLTNIKIENRYINYFVKCNNEWYVILRIVFAVNTGVLASHTYTIFYKLNKGIITFKDSDNSIEIDPKHYDNDSKFTLGIFRTNNTNEIKLKNTTYTPITESIKDDIFFALRKFRNVQLTAYDIKQTAVNEAITAPISFFDWFG